MSENLYHRVKLARDSKRPTGLDYIRHIFKDFTELHGDRRFADDPAIVGGIAWLSGMPVTVIAIEKGHTAKERGFRNFGAPHPEGYRKALRLMKQAEKFGRPIVLFVDTSGAYCGIGAEERGQGQGHRGKSPGNVHVVRADRISDDRRRRLRRRAGAGGRRSVWMLENAVYSVISPEGCASILWKDAAKAGEAAACLKLTAQDAKEFGLIEQIISEAGIGKKEYYDRIGALLTEELRALCMEPNLLELRYRRFRKIGAYETEEETR